MKVVPSSEQKIELLEKELERAREHIRKLKEEVTVQREALERRNKEVDALGRVWCDGGCYGGMNRYRNYKEPPNVTSGQVAFLLRNARRAYSWYVNHGGRERDEMLRQGEKVPSLNKVWKNRRKDVVAVLIERHEAEIEKLKD